MPLSVRLRRACVPVLLALLCAAGIWYLCLMRPPSVKLSFTDVPGFDKVVHVGMYAAMCGLLWFEYLRHHTRLRPLRLLLGAVCLPALMSGVIEVAQDRLTTTRSADVFDFVANVLGILLAAGAGVLYHRYRQQR